MFLQAETQIANHNLKFDEENQECPVEVEGPEQQEAPVEKEERADRIHWGLYRPELKDHCHQQGLSHQRQPVLVQKSMSNK